jgi:hypothetical protein
LWTVTFPTYFPMEPGSRLEIRTDSTPSCNG